MRVLMLLSNPFTHDPRVYNEARSLIKAGYKVTVLAWDRKNNNSIKEIKDGIEVIRVRNTAFMNLLPYDILRLHLWWIEGYKKAVDIYEKESFDVVHCHDFDTLPIGVKLKRKFNIPLIYDSHEIWSYMISRDIPWWKYYAWKEKKLLKYVDEIITVGEGPKKYLRSISNKTITIIMNSKNLITKEYVKSENRELTLIYIGSLYKSRFLLETVDAVGNLDGVKCIIGGLGKNEYVKKLKKKISETNNVVFIGKVPMKEVIPLTQKADVVVCMFDPQDPLTKIGLPNKLFEAMVAGRPLIASKGTYVAKIVEKEKCGLVVDYNIESFREAVITLRDNKTLREELGKNALKAAVREYNWASQERKLMGLYERILGGNGK